MDRLKALLKRFESQKNEELFPICISQVADLYCLKPQEFSLLIFEVIRNLIMHKSTYKRLIGAALFEKISFNIHESQDLQKFLIKRKDLNFDAEEFIKSLHKRKRKKTTRKQIEYKEIIKIDLLKLSQEQVRSYLSRRDNFLFSKSSKTLEKKEKSSRRISWQDEEAILDKLQNEEDNNFDFLKKKNIDRNIVEGLELKKVKEKTENHEQNELTLKDYVQILDQIFDLCKFLIFHHNWEFRHGALLIFRSMARNNLKIFSIEQIITLQNWQNEKIEKLQNSEISQKMIKDIQTSLNEEIKQKCLILLSLDRFSDFMSDKSIMTNRALAVEILVITFKNQNNFQDFFFLNEILFVQNIKAGWEPKQAFIFLCKSLLESKQNNKELITQKQLMTIIKQLFRIILEHEEITEVAAEFLSELITIYPKLLSKKDQHFMQSWLLESLILTEDISYLPKSVFEYFTQVLVQNNLIDEVIGSLEDIIKKFLFHNNKDVRKVIFVFIKKFFNVIKNNSHIANMVNDDKKNFFFFTFLFYFLIENQVEEEQDIFESISNILTAMKDKEKQFQTLMNLLKLLDYKYLYECINQIDNGFFYNIDKSNKINFLLIFELILFCLKKLDNEILLKLFKQLKNEQGHFINSLYAIIYLILIDNQKIDIENEKEYFSFLYFDLKNFSIPFYDDEVNNFIKEVENFLTENLDFLNEIRSIQKMDSQIYKLLIIADQKEPLKNRFEEVHNSFVDFLQNLEDCIFKGIIDKKHSKIFIEIKNRIQNKILKHVSTLHEFSQFYCTFIKCAASGVVLSKCIQNNNLPELKQINYIVKPFLEIFKHPLNGYWKLKLGNAFSRMIFIYKNEQKHPNNKILNNIYKKMDKSSNIDNFYFYFKNIIYLYNQSLFEKFPIFRSFFDQPTILSVYYKIFLNFPSQKKTTRLFYQNQFIDCFKKGLFNNEKYFDIIRMLFERLNEDFCQGETENMNKFLLHFYNMIIQRQQIYFQMLFDLIENYKKDFIIFSKIYLSEILKCLNEILKYDKEIIFECFINIITLSYLDVERKELQQLDQTLIDSFVTSKRFLFEFQNNQNFEIDLSQILNPIENFKLKPYQFEGIKWVNFLFKYGLSGSLCDDMGLGKTIQSLLAVGLIYQNQNDLNDSLVVCPNNLVYHWQQECMKYINPQLFTPIVLNLKNTKHHKNWESIKDQFKSQNKNFLFIASYHTLLRITHQVKSVNFKVIVLDEAHMIKNPKNQLSLKIKQIQCKLRLALTGTPIQNNVAELWSIFDFLMPLYLGSKEAFRKKYRALLDLHLISLDTNKMELTSNQTIILKKLHVKALPFIMRREKKDVLKDLPPKIIQDFYAKLTPIQEEIYDYFKNSDNFDVSQADNSKMKYSFLKILSNLRKIMNHPKLLLTKNKKDGIIKQKQIHQYEQILNKMVTLKDLKQNFYLSGKFQALKSLLNILNYFEYDEVSCLDNPSKMLLFTRCNKTLELLKQFFKKQFKYLKFLMLHQKQNPQERHDIVEDFNKNKAYKLLLLTPKIGGLGLNLASASVVIMFDHDFNPMNDLQAMDRAHRLGQKKSVNVYRLIMKDTLEEKIMGIQKFKLSVANTVINIENTSIDNVKKSKFVDFLESFATENIKEEKEDKLYKSFGAYAKYLKNSNLEEMWDEDEYQKEYI